MWVGCRINTRKHIMSKVFFSIAINREKNMPYPSYAKKNMILVHNVVSRLELDMLGILLTPWNDFEAVFL